VELPSQTVGIGNRQNPGIIGEFGTIPKRGTFCQMLNLETAQKLTAWQDEC
jgi:hypothetical protein